MTLICDYVTILAAEEGAFLLRNWFFQSSSLHISWLNFWIIFPALFLLLLHLNQLYSRRRPFFKEAEMVFHACVYATLTLSFLLYAARLAGSTSRFFTVTFGITAFVFLTLARYGLKRFLMGRGLLQVQTIVIGAGKTAELLARAIEGDAGLGYKIIGLLEDNRVCKGGLEKYPLLGGFADAERVIKETGVKHVFIAAPGLRDEALGRLIYRVQPLVKNIGVIPNLVGVPLGSVEAESIFSEKLLILRLKNNLARPLNRAIKLVFDYTLTIVGTICISPLLLYIAYRIKKEDPGPIFFAHTRIGKDGKSFPCYKFRSMVVNSKDMLETYLAENPAAREEWERDFKLKDDPRVTPIGKILRKTSLDELPQIFNVLRGEMSLVGPRPIIAEELARYGEYVGDYLMVKPGITGMWQVSGRSDIEYSERVQLDSWYVRNWSMWLDFMLLFKTFAVVLGRKGAY
ncbi:MAG: undecaprenyl-phosphate galactose phosphotransferase WbaP [Phascolarctobacterium sp.]|uniref:undecaprenyl-phosphate galactose phosphotransferase WbaP n=1 Tax=Phascolarctobacterium sp. TaxID=2049039 RepID=UPI0026DAF14D|nr:undecaprenyl-phosphate galactose phosphotransferase WbaP [Phascolarctobacterium sp.]MDO4921916.1 undecaprenyl-phosphate galactose phosphotransferase WbaP [Phascolarctobacterium sp.]